MAHLVGRQQEPDWVGEAEKLGFDKLVLTKASDWFDPRLRLAYALIDEVLDEVLWAKDHLRKAAEAIEDADLALEQGQTMPAQHEEYDDRPEWELRTGFREEDFS